VDVGITVSLLARMVDVRHGTEAASIGGRFAVLAMATLRSTLTTLANSFADSVLAAIRAASLEDLLAEVTAAKGRPAGRARGAVQLPGLPTGRGSLKEPPAGRAARSGRLKRRSPDDIAEALDRVLALVKKSKTGLRAEQIRATLGMQSKEMPRVLKEGLAKKKLRTTGQKRATTYTAT
jgi:hypothetical protein